MAALNVRPPFAPGIPALEADEEELCRCPRSENSNTAENKVISPIPNPNRFRLTQTALLLISSIRPLTGLPQNIGSRSRDSTYLFLKLSAFEIPSRLACSPGTSPNHAQSILAQDLLRPLLRFSFSSRREHRNGQ